MKRDYYDVLGLSRTASEADIKKAFRALAREIHPDVNRSDPQAETKFKEAAEAYECLSNPESRATFDRYGFEGLKRGGFQDFSQFSFEDIIRSFFGEGLFGEELFGGGWGRPARGADVAATVEITLEDAAAGVTREIEYEVVDRCSPCEGSGVAPGTSSETCAACNGNGQVRTVTRSAFGQFVRSGPCKACAGKGSIISIPCEDCRGRGLVMAHQKLDLDIPAGIEDGQSIRLSGKGSLGEHGGPPGDLYARVMVKEHDKLARDGNDLVYHQVLTIIDAAIGMTVMVPTLEGEAEVEVKPGTQFGEVRVLKGKGMPLLRGRGKGDLKVIMDIIVPRNLDNEQKELLMRFAETTSDKNYHRDEGLLDKIRAAFS